MYFIVLTKKYPTLKLFQNFVEPGNKKIHKTIKIINYFILIKYTFILIKYLSLTCDEIITFSIPNLFFYIFCLDFFDFLYILPHIIKIHFLNL